MSDDLLMLAFPRELAGRVPAFAARERLLLATCERLEVYLVGDRDALGVAGRAAARVCREDAAAEHMLRVACGLESRLVGEPQIQGQLRAAFLLAQERRAVGPVLNALARAALHAGKRVRSETGLGRAATVVTLTLARLADELAGLRRRSLLVAGTGPLAVEVARALRAAGAGRLFVASSATERARALAARLGGQALDSALGAPGLALDGIVTCTNRRVSLRALASRPGASGRALSIVDLGAPPNVDPGEVDRPGVRLTRLSDLVAASGAVQSQTLRAAERLIAEELQRFRRWRDARLLHARLRREAA